MAKALVENETAPVDVVPPGRVRDRARDGLRRARRQDQPKEKRSKEASPARRPSERRYHQTIRRVDLWSVLNISICFYLCALVVVLAAGMVLWWIATTFGAIDSVEKLVGDFIGSDDFELLSWRILRGATLIGLVMVCLMVVVTTLGAAFYNLFSELLGGIEVTVVEDD